MEKSTAIRFISEYRFPVAAFAIALIVGLYLAVRIVMDLIYFNDPRHQDQTLRGWMTPQYVMKSYDLPRTIVEDIFEIDPDVPQRRKMRYIAERMDLSLDELTVKLREQATLYRDSQ